MFSDPATEGEVLSSMPRWVGVCLQIVGWVLETHCGLIYKKKKKVRKNFK